MIYFIWAVFARMAPFKPITMDDGWDQMNRSYMYVLSITLACFVDFGLISGQAIKCTGFEEVFTEEFAENYCWTQGERDVCVYCVDAIWSVIPLAAV